MSMCGVSLRMSVKTGMMFTERSSKKLAASSANPTLHCTVVAGRHHTQLVGAHPRGRGELLAHHEGSFLFLSVPNMLCLLIAGLDLWTQEVTVSIAGACEVCEDQLRVGSRAVVSECE